MADITLKGTPIHTVGELPPVNNSAPSFTLTGADLGEVQLSDYDGKRKVLSVVPSLDTSVCAVSSRTFNERAASQANCVVMVISADLPFAQKRFCEAEGIENVVCLSCFRAPSFGSDYGTTIVDGPLAGLQSRAVLVLDEQNNVVYGEQVPEIAQEPDYDAALAALSG